MLAIGLTGPVSAQQSSADRKPGSTITTTTHLPANTFRVAIFDSPPLSLLDDDGEAEGFIVDLITEIARLEGFEIIWVHEDWPIIIERIKRRDLELITSVGFTDERDEYMDFAQTSFVNVWGQVFLPTNSSIENIFDLDDKRIGVLAHGVNGIRFRAQCEKFEVNCQFFEYGNYQEVFAGISAGELEAGVSNNLVGYSLLPDNDMISSSIVFDPFKVYVASPQNSDSALLHAYDRHLSRWKQNPDSFYYQTRSKWLIPQMDSGLPTVILYLILGLVAFSLTAFVFAVLLRHQVRLRVRDLSHREQQLEQIINLVPHMIFVADSKGNVILANQTTCDYFGMNSEQFVGTNLNALKQERRRYCNLLDDNLDSHNNRLKPMNSEIETRDHHGNEHILYLSKMPYLGRKDREPAVVTVAVDITDAKKFEEKIKFMAQHDSLTDLPNRMLLKDRIDHSLALSSHHNHNGAILFIDLDHLKNINDSQGHRTGDLVIKDVASRLRGCVRPGDTIARLGGDEFIVVLSQLEQDVELAESQARQNGKHILNIIAKPYQINQDTFHITASMGIVLYPRDGTTQEVLLQRADTAMYEAKAIGRNRMHVFTQELESQLIERVALENELRQAVSRDELYLVYQPVMHGEALNVAGCEALLRWNHPTRGMVRPGDFIALAEQKNLITGIGDWVLEAVCKQIRQWLDEGQSGFFISANLSVIQLKDEDFYHKISNLIRRYQIPKNYLELEVTESILMTETMRSTKIFKQLKLLGIRISIDDFGTGYSSFNYLIKLPLDKIKIDQSFIKNLPGDDSSATIVTTIMRMARELEMDVVAEGIETCEQYEFLLQQSCTYYQGYYFHKPVPHDELARIATA